MSIPFIISLNIARLIAILGGTALPGLIGLTLYPNLINKSVKKNRLRSIVVTGTNGKTTTTRLLGRALDLAGINYCHNYSGSNLLRGIATTLINQSDGLGRIKPNFGIWEIDEAAAPEIMTALRPEIILFTNISRDQLDRYGELDILLSKWQRAICRLPSTRVLINAADRRLRCLTHRRLKFFGKSRPGAGLEYPPQYQGKLNLDNFWAVEAIIRELKLDSDLVYLAARSLPPVFGRGEKINFNGKNWQINLVKNPASYQAVWQMLLKQRRLNRPLLLLLNDKLADGTDVSWIWDVPFTKVNRRLKPLIVSGTRAADLALRLKYAGLDTKKIIIEPDPIKAIRKLAAFPGKTGYILPTYTAMLNLRRRLGLTPWN